MKSKHLMLTNVFKIQARAEKLREKGLAWQAETCEDHIQRLQQKYNLDMFPELMPSQADALRPPVESH